MSDWIEFDNWPYELLEKKINWDAEVKRRERMMILTAEYYGRGRTDDEKARSIGVTRAQYWRLKQKHGLLEDKDGYLREPRQYTEEWWDEQDHWHDN